MPLIANARMYAVNADVASAWRTLLEWVLAHAGVSGEVIDYPAPQPLPALWERPDAACVFMCGYPIANAQPAPQVLAAPVPAPARYGNAPVYFTDVITRAESPLHELADAFGKRFAFTTEDSQSGYQAPRRLLAPFARERGGRLFASVSGPLQTPRRIVESVLSGDVDAGPLDSYFHDLLRQHEPALAVRLRVLASTPPTPMPALVAAAGVPVAIARKLAVALLAVADADELGPVRAALSLRRFAAVAAADYATLRADAIATDATGYIRIA